MSKRNLREDDGPSKKARTTTNGAIHPFFSSPAAKGQAGPSRGSFDESKPSLVHYVYNDVLTGTPPKEPVSVVMLDLDGTLIHPKSGKKFPSDRNDWKWWDTIVPSRLAELHKEGKHIVILSNQGYTQPKRRKEWKEKLPLISDKLGDIPIRVFGATEKDVFRKPRTGMWDYLVQIYKDKGWKIDQATSIYVGDACGRPSDHSNTDYTMALNAGLKFLTPEEYFQDRKVSYPKPPKSFRPGTALDDSAPPVVPSNTPITRDAKEIVLFIGQPASGKTSFFRKHFSSRYEHINQDTLRTRDACVRAARRELEAGRSVVIDNTNRNRATRKYYIDLAKEMKVGIRAFHLAASRDLAEHNNLYRALYPPPGEPARSLLPGIAYSTYNSDYEAPKATEGFDEIKTVNFVFEGTEAQRKLWDQYLL